MAVKAVPDGYGTVTPSLLVSGASEAIDFITRAFGGQERMRMPGPDGRIMHAEVSIGDGLVMVADEMPGFPATRSVVYLYVPDVDATYRKALDLGATSDHAPEDMFYGDRSAAVLDRWGTRWSLATHIEDVSEEEIDRRMANMAPPAVN